MCLTRFSVHCAKYEISPIYSGSESDGFDMRRIMLPAREIRGCYWWPRQENIHFSGPPCLSFTRCVQYGEITRIATNRSIAALKFSFLQSWLLPVA